MSWFSKLSKKLLPVTARLESSSKKGVPEGVWTQCPACNASLFNAELERNMYVCPHCDQHMRISARKRLDYFLDKEGRFELAMEIEAVDHLRFRDHKKYKDRIASAQRHLGEKDALVVMQGTLHNMPLVVAAFDFRFIGGSMGSGVGARFVAAADAAMQQQIPLVCFSSSGGARMQEGLISLMQMAKTSAALAKLASEGLPFISVLTDPTTGGVSASLAMLGDIIIAEPNATIGFAGSRVIEQTVRQQLPEGFQRSDFLLDHGAIDMIVGRHDLRRRIGGLISKLTNQAAVYEAQP